MTPLQKFVAPFLADASGRPVGLLGPDGREYLFGTLVTGITLAYATLVTTYPPAQCTGLKARVTEGITVVSDGTNWVPDGVQMFSDGAPLTAAPADTNENAVLTVTIPGGLLGATGGFRLRADVSMTNNANAKTWRGRFSGASGAQYLAISLTSTGSGSLDVAVQNTAAGAQVGTGVANGSVNAQQTSSVDTTADSTFLLTMQKGTAGDTCTLRRYNFEVWA
jgi:hypothetical protein